MFAAKICQIPVAGTGPEFKEPSEQENVMVAVKGPYPGPDPSNALSITWDQVNGGLSDSVVRI